MTLSEEVGTEKGAILNEQYKAPKKSLTPHGIFWCFALGVSRANESYHTPIYAYEKKKEREIVFSRCSLLVTFHR